MSPLDITRSSLFAGIPHGFLGRKGGVSTGIHAGLNVGLGSDDERDAVTENRRLAREGVLTGSELVTLHQVHSAEVVTVTSSNEGDARPRADALVTDRPGLLLGILTADCVPVLFVDSATGIVGAAHAGWKGALGGITDNVIAAMEALGADRTRITAAIGPCIARTSYEVDAAFAQRFEDADPANERFFSAGRADHFQFDLEAYVANRLAAAGLTQIEMLGLDTYTNADRFFSFRRTTHRREADYGRQISLIGISKS